LVGSIEMGSGHESSFNVVIERSENRSNSASARSGARHDFIRLAESLNDELHWLKAGLALIRAAEWDDLTPQVSDQFVEVCPDSIFAQLPSDSRAMRFVGWRKRIQQAHGC
jgi:hypothetical protein